MYVEGDVESGGSDGEDVVSEDEKNEVEAELDEVENEVEADTKAITSPFVTLPSLPVPSTSCKLTEDSLAILLVEGVAITSLADLLLIDVFDGGRDSPTIIGISILISPIVVVEVSGDVVEIDGMGSEDPSTSVSTSHNIPPTLTISPTNPFINVILPENGEVISTVALSDLNLRRQ